MVFSGFTGSTLYTPVPNPVFGPLLEQIQDLAELKVTLRGLWLFHRKRGPVRSVSLDEFLADRTLLKGLKSEGKDTAEEIRRGLRLAVTRGTFLTHQLANRSDGTETIFLLNTEADRRALARLKTGEVASEIEEGAGEPPELDKPNIFALYEDGIGALSPLLAEELKEAEARYPESWLREAFGIAVAENKRSWRYVAGILRRWTAEGKENRGDYAASGEVGEGNYGKSGRHTEKDQRQKYLEDYQRRRGNTPRQRAGR
ncbi:MAG TPA: primosomal replication protein N [Dehalococcoidia bacterium]|nr:primosomal replication protein N [Chloroflexota bacterium]MQF94549.1 DnaD domain protein [SAR202 cluster bacterium]HAA95139.1 primosomal replication protein N [Dehalococcoidia bacterium]HCL25229.1 primosomal replication protein N [Dehalococcoidia bacterium]|tara:strand:- start:4972 stop:5745 length:774 start_codon:yes stop_codon:yes gene_type:complete